MHRILSISFQPGISNSKYPKELIFQNRTLENLSQQYIVIPLKSSKRYFITGPLVVVSICLSELARFGVGCGFALVTTRTKKQKQAHLRNKVVPGREIVFIN